LEVRRPGAAASRRRIQAGYDIDLYADHFDHDVGLSFANDEPNRTISDLRDAARVAIRQTVQPSEIEIIPGDESFVLNVKSHLDPEAMVRIRITHSRGLEQPAGDSEDKARATVEERLNTLGVKRSLSIRGI